MNITDKVLDEVFEEYICAVDKFPAFKSAHEGYAVILEELDELWHEVKQRDRDDNAMRKEAIQVATMAIRFVIDICPEVKR